MKEGIHLAKNSLGSGNCVALQGQFFTPGPVSEFAMLTLKKKKKSARHGTDNQLDHDRESRKAILISAPEILGTRFFSPPHSVPPMRQRL